ncbi:hypothetical protein ACIGG9_29170 [Pseudonocardia alni]
MDGSDGLPELGAVFWPVGTGDSTTLVVDDEVVVQVDLHDMAKAQEDTNAEMAVVDRLVDALPVQDGAPYLAVFVLTHADKDHCLGFADLLDRVRIGELWSTPRLWREYADPDAPELCADAIAFREESERRIRATLAAVEAGGQPDSGDRIRVVGHDADQSTYVYDGLPAEYLTGPGKALSVLDGRDCADRFTAFIHAPFKADAAAERNETSLSMQVTLTSTDTESGLSGPDGKLLLFGDLAHDTIMKIMDYSEYHDREHYLEWDVLLAPHHCSKRVMYAKNADGDEVVQFDVLEAFERHARTDATVVCSSATIPATDVAGANPPHRKAYDRYRDLAITGDVICTMSWLDESMPSPIVFGVDATGARIVRPDVVMAAPREAKIELAAAAPGHRLAAVTAAAVGVARALPTPEVTNSDVGSDETGLDRVQAAVAADRGGDAPDNPVGFGR